MTEKRRGGDVMARIDTACIEGFDSMTAEQKVDALLGLQIPDKVDLSRYVPKDTADKYASEAAEAKRKLRAMAADGETAKTDHASAVQQMQEKYDELQSRYDEILKTSTIAANAARYMSMPGYSEELARETAEALYAGDMDKVFENQRTAAQAHEKQIRADAMKSMTPMAGGKSDGASAEVEYAKKVLKGRADSAEAAKNAMSYYL